MKNKKRGPRTVITQSLILINYQYKNILYRYLIIYYYINKNI